MIRLFGAFLACVVLYCPLAPAADAPPLTVDIFKQLLRKYNGVDLRLVGPMNFNLMDGYRAKDARLELLYKLSVDVVRALEKGKKLPNPSAENPQNAVAEILAEQIFSDLESDEVLKSHFERLVTHVTGQTHGKTPRNFQMTDARLGYSKVMGYWAAGRFTPEKLEEWNATLAVHEWGNYSLGIPNRNLWFAAFRNEVIDNDLLSAGFQSWFFYADAGLDKPFATRPKWKWTSDLVAMARKEVSDLEVQMARAFPSDTPFDAAQKTKLIDAFVRFKPLTAKDLVQAAEQVQIRNKAEVRRAFPLLMNQLRYLAQPFSRPEEMRPWLMVYGLFDPTAVVWKDMQAQKNFWEVFLANPPESDTAFIRMALPFVKIMPLTLRDRHLKEIYREASEKKRRMDQKFDALEACDDVLLRLK